ncbi:MAG: hypothetical protein V4657_03905 [Pseudomonadota bacterium]
MESGHYIGTMPKIYADGGNLVLEVEGRVYIVPWSVVMPTLRHVQRIADQFDTDSRGKVCELRGAGAGH